MLILKAAEPTVAGRRELKIDGRRESQKQFGNSAEQSPEARSGNLHIFTFTFSHFGVEMFTENHIFIYIFINIYININLFSRFL